MADVLDGTRYISLDSARFGDKDRSGGAGSTDRTSLPVSTYLENVLDNNARYLWSRGERLSYDFFADPAEGEKPFTHIGRANLLYIPYRVLPSLDAIDLWLQGSIENDDSNTTGEIVLELGLYLPTLGERIKKSGSLKSGAAGVNTHTESLDLSDVGLPRTLGLVTVRIESADFVTIDSADVTEPSSFEYSDGAGAGSIIDDTDETTSWDFGDAEGNLYDATQVLTDVNGPIVTGAVVGDISYIKPRTATLKFDYDETRERGGYTAKQPASMRAQQTVEGPDVAHHGQNTDEAFGRPQLVATGPKPLDGAAEESYPTGYGKRWPYTDTSSSGKLDGQMIRVPEDKAKVTCLAMVMAWRYVSADGLAWHKGPIKESIAEYTEVGDGDFQMKCQQLDDGDTQWSDATTLLDTTQTSEGIFVFPETRNAEAPVSLHIQNGRHEKEGILTDGDLAIIGEPSLISLTGTLSTSSHPLDPIRAELHWDSWSSGPSAPGGGIDRYTTDKYEMWCLSTSWYVEGVTT